VTAAAKAITCPNCGGSTEIKAAGYTVTLVCQYCSSVLDVANPDVSIITAYNEAAAELEIPLGTRGSINGIEWEVIGYITRSDSEMEWDEYLLFNPYAGYRWLSKVEDEWSLGVALTSTPQPTSGASVTLGDQSFTKRYDAETVTVDYVLGEFYWRVATGEQVTATEFYGRGKALSLEESGSEINWTLNERIPSSLIGNAFGLAEIVDEAGDAALAQQGKRGPLTMMFMMAAAAAVLMMVLTMMFGLQGKQAVQRFALELERPAKTMPVGSITISRPYQTVTLTAKADTIQNQWIDLDYSLVNRATQQSINAYGVVEYYEGSDSDGSWSEGGRGATTKIAGVPRGTYDIMVDAEAHNWSGGSSTSSFAGNDGTGSGTGEAINVTIGAAGGGVFGSNIFLFLLLIFGPPLWMLYRRLKESGHFVSSDDDDDE
jgi:hypothetical protein